MIYDYPNKKFIEDGRADRLRIQGFAFVQAKPVGFAYSIANEPEQDSATIYKDVDFIFANGILSIYSEGKKLFGITNFMFMMSDSEVSSAVEQQYKKNSSYAIDSIYPEVFEPGVKLALQAAIEQLAEANGIKVAEGIKFFNDKLVLYTSPFLRGLANSSTNFYKIMEDLREHSVTKADGTSYMITPEMLEQANLSDAIKSYLGTNSKEITKFIANRLIKKTDLVKSLSPQLLEILTNQSGRIFQSVSAGVVGPEVKILTCYEDIMLDTFTYVKYIMDVFSGNIDHTQKFLNLDKSDNFYTNKEAAKFLSANFSHQKIFSILTSEGNYQSYLRDVVQQHNEYKDPKSIPAKLRMDYPNGLTMPKNWKTLKELHDKVSAHYNRIKTEDNNKPIEYTPEEFQLHGMVEGGIELVLPSEGKTLVDWGKDQSHCVASYADRAARKELMILGVKVDGVHTYTLELRINKKYVPTVTKEQIAQTNADGLLEGSVQWENKVEYSCDIHQFRGRSNSNPKPEHKEIVEKLIFSVIPSASRVSYKQCERFDELVNAGIVGMQGIDAQLRANGG